jgi:peptide/nickel transport system permease protein
VGIYAIRRFLLIIPTVIVAAVVIFVLIRLLPGDLAVLMAGESATPADVERIREDLDLNDSFVVQFGNWAAGFVRGDFGVSAWTGEPIQNEISNALPVSLQLAIGSVIISVAVSLVLGVIAAVKQDSIFDYGARVVALFGLTLPTFWMGVLALLVVSKYFHWVPPTGYVPFYEDPWTNVQQFMFPWLIQAFVLTGLTTRMVRSSVLEVLRQDYVRTARAKGLRESTVMYRHILKNAMLPVLTLIGIQLVVLVTLQLPLELIFSLPGMGRLLLGSVNFRDYEMLQGVIIVIALIIAGVNLAIDLSYGFLDPRISYQ